MDHYKPELDNFHGDSNPEIWVIQAEQYFNFYGFSKDSWLSMPYVYFKGEARAWFDWLYRNDQFWDWNHFKEKLVMHYQNRTFANSMEKPKLRPTIAEQGSEILRQLAELRDAFSACTTKLAAQEFSTVELTLDATDSALPVPLPQLDDELSNEDSPVNVVLADNSKMQLSQVTEELNKVFPLANIIFPCVTQQRVSTDEEDDCLENIVDKMLDTCSQGQTAAAAVANTKQLWADFKKLPIILDCHVATPFSTQCVLPNFPFDPGANQLFIACSPHHDTQSLDPFFTRVSFLNSHDSDYSTTTLILSENGLHNSELHSATFKNLGKHNVLPDAYGMFWWLYCDFGLRNRKWVDIGKSMILSGETAYGQLVHFLVDLSIIGPTFGRIMAFHFTYQVLRWTARISLCCGTCFIWKSDPTSPLVTIAKTTIVASIYMVNTSPNSFFTTLYSGAAIGDARANEQCDIIFHQICYGLSNVQNLVSWFCPEKEIDSLVNLQPTKQKEISANSENQVFTISFSPSEIKLLDITLTLTPIESVVKIGKSEEGIDVNLRVEGFKGAGPFHIYVDKWFDTGQGIRFQIFSTSYLFASDSCCAVIKKIEELSTGILLNILYPCSSADSIYELYPYDPGPHVPLPSTDGSVWREGDVGNVLLSLHGNSGGCSYDIAVAPKDACYIDVHLDILELDGFVRKPYIFGEVPVLKALEFVAKREHPSTYTYRSLKQKEVQYGVFPLVHLDIFLVAAVREGNFIPCKQVDLPGMLGLVENVFGYVLISLVPLCNGAKLAVFIYLLFPDTMETTFVQNCFFRPMILGYEIGIDKNLLVMRTQAGYILFLYWKYSIDACREFVVLHKLMRSLDTTYPFDPGQLKIAAIQVTSVGLEFASLSLNKRVKFIQVKARIVEIPLIAAVNFQFMVPSVNIMPTFLDCSSSKVFATILLRNKVTWYMHQWVGFAAECRVLDNEPSYDICFISLLMAKMCIKEVDDFGGVYSKQMAAKESMKEKSIADPITNVISYRMRISCRAEAFLRARVFKNMAAMVIEYILCLKEESCSCIIGLHLVVNIQKSCYMRVNRGHTWLLLLELKIQALASIQYSGDYSNSRGPKALLTCLESAWLLILRGLNNSKALYFMNPPLQTLLATSILRRHSLRVEHKLEVVLLYRGWPYNSFIS